MKKEKNLALIYSAVGHALMHMFAAFYFVIVLAIEKVWLLPYEELLKLWVLGSLLVGVAAIPAGWLSDRWSRSGMMLVMFLGLGISSLLCGISYNQTTLFIGLTFLGLFCAIYHPVAIAWVVNSSKKKGRALGINGIFGVMGIGNGWYFCRIFDLGLSLKCFISHAKHWLREDFNGPILKKNFRSKILAYPKTSFFFWN